MDTNLKDKIVFISGSSRGIGKGIAECFLEERSIVVLTGRDQESLKETYTEFSSKYGVDRVSRINGDLIETENVKAAVEDVITLRGRIDILVPNIGGTASPGWEQGDDEWERVLDQNFWGSVRLTEAVIPYMIEQSGGTIVYVSSIAGIEEIGAPITYTTAKASITAAAKSYARQLGKYNIRVNCVAPGNILFPGGAWERKLKERHEEIMQMIEQEVPLGRFGKPEDVANIVVFLASDLASFMTGTCVVADGGQTRKLF